MKLMSFLILLIGFSSFTLCAMQDIDRTNTLGICSIVTLDDLPGEQHTTHSEGAPEIIISREEELQDNIVNIRRVFFEKWLLLDYGGDLNHDKFKQNNKPLQRRLQRQYHTRCEDFVGDMLWHFHLCTPEERAMYLAENKMIEPMFLTGSPSLQHISPAHFWGPLVKKGGVAGFQSLHEHGLSKEALYHNPDALCEACRQGKLDVITFLLDNGANPNGVEYDGTYGLTPLMQTCLYGRVDAAKLLMNRGADRTIQNSENANRTALMYACALGQLELAKFLAVNSADLALVDSDGFTALEYIIASPIIDEVAKDNFRKKILKAASGGYVLK